MTTLFLLFTTLISFSLISSSDLHSDQINELLSLQSSSDSGVIHLNDRLVSRFLTSVKTPRPYSLLIFFDAVHLHERSELGLPETRKEFGILASSFIANNANGSSSSSSSSTSNARIFFCDIEFKESQSSFTLFGVNALPNIGLIREMAGNLKADSIGMDNSASAWEAESMAEFLESRSKFTIGPIKRPPILSRNQLILVTMLILISIPYIIKKILTGKTLVHDPKVWLLGSLFIYFFSVSGTMYTIIRNTPMLMKDQNSPETLIFFYEGSGMQLGAEGFAVGFLYTVVGLLLAFLTNLLVRVRNVTIQRIVMLSAICISFWAVKKVIDLDSWKTGYKIHGFWPSSW